MDSGDGAICDGRLLHFWRTILNSARVERAHGFVIQPMDREAKSVGRRVHGDVSGFLPRRVALWGY